MKLGEKRGKKNIKLLGASSLINDIGSEMITPILPFFIATLGGTGLAIGLLSGLREGLSSILKLFGGWLSDRLGKRMPFVFFGYITSIIFRALLYLSTTWQLVITFISLERIGKTRDAPRDAIITDSTDQRGRGFGIHQMMDTSGGILGSILVLILFWTLNIEFKTIIIIAAIISTFSLIPLFFVKEPKTKAIRRGLFREIKKMNKKLRYFIFVTSIFTLGNFGLYMFLVFRAKQITNSIVIALFLYVVFNIVWASFTIPFGTLSDKIGRKKVLMMGYVLFFLVGLGFVFQEGIVYLSSLFVLYGLVFAITQSNQRAFVSDLADKMKGTAMGTFYFITGIMNIIGGLIAGILWDISIPSMFVYITSIAFISIVLLAFVKE